ncbi:hypothetical protein VNI00_005927 [Paramarasmius palmivorus]|uniref:Secreted protein n=1 Tax=Paramarasmius palmivorus TaxID=297713 RepID=A0AAW0DD38_9AGAR
MFASLFVTVALAVSAMSAALREEVIDVARAERPTTTISPATTTSISVPTATGPPNFNMYVLLNLAWVERIRMPSRLGLLYPERDVSIRSYVVLVLTLTPDQHTAVTITFSAFEASAGPDIAVTLNRRNCQVSLNVHVPQGFSFAIVDVDYRGFYSLDDKVKAFHDSVYYFQGQIVQAEATSTLVGPIPGNVSLALCSNRSHRATSGKNYVYRDEFNLTPTIYSPCGEDSSYLVVPKILNINSQVRVDNSGNKKGYGYIADDSIDASIKQTFNFQWLQC